MGNTLECCTQSVNVDTNDLSSDEDDETYKLLHNPITKGGDHGGIKDGNKQSNKHNHKHPKRGKHKDRAIKRIKKKAQYSKGKKRNKSKNESDTEVTMIWVDEELYKSDMEHDDNDNNTPSHEMKMISPSNDSDDSSESVISPSSNDSSSSDETDSDSDSDSNTDSDTDTDSSSGSTSDSDSNSEANTEQHHVEGPQTEIEAINNVDSNRNDIHGHVMQKTYINVDMDSLDKEMMAILSKENVNTPNNLNNLPPGDPGLGNHHSQESHHKMLSLIKGISTDILEQSGILARDDEKKEVQLQQNEEEINPVLPLNLPLPEAPKNNNMRMKKSRSRERKSKQEQYEALRKELDDAEIRLKQSKHEKKILQKENSALRQENHVLKTSGLYLCT